MTYMILGLLLFFFQVFHINYMALKHKMFHENNYVPALFYAILGLTFFNCISLTPSLLGMCFILPSMDSLFSHIETRNKTDGNLINIGLMTGLASLIYLPYATFILIHFLSLLFFTNTIRRRYLLMLYSFLIPFILVWLLYVWRGESQMLLYNFVLSAFKDTPVNYISFVSIGMLTGITVLIYVMSSFKILSGLGFNIFQVRIQKIMLFASVVALITWFLFSDKSGHSFVIFLPWATFFLSHFFLSIKHALKRELGFLLYAAVIIILYFGVPFHWFNLDKGVDLSNLLVKKLEYTPSYQDKKVMVIGSDINPFFYCRQSTPYFNWNLSKVHLEHLDYYDNLEAIDQNIRRDMPDIIIDQMGIAPDLFDRLPLLKKEFTLVEKGMYRRLESSS